MYQLLRYVIVICGVVGITELYSRGFGIDFDRNAVYMPVLLFTVLFVPLSDFILARLAVYAGLGIYIYGQITRLSFLYKNAVKGLMNICYNILGDAFDFPIVDGFERAAENGSYEISLLFMSLCLILTAAIIVLVRYRAVITASLFMGLSVCICAFLGCECSPKACFLVYISVFGMVVLKKGFGKLRLFGCRNGYKNISPGYGIMLAAAVAFMVSAGVLFSRYITAERVKSTIPVTKTENTVRRVTTDMAAMWFSDYKKNTQAINARGGELSFFNKMDLKQVTRFRLNLVPFTQDKLFFKFYTGSKYVYGLNKWENTESTDTSYVEEARRNLDNSGIVPDVVQLIKNKNDSRIFDSYNCTSPDIKYLSDDMLYSDKAAEKYELKIYPQSAFNENSEYRDFVYDNYTYISDENKQVIGDICTQKGFSNDDSLLADLQNYFKNDFEFAYSTDITPLGKDYVNYFLTETRQGNFVHFASASVLIYRYLGIPARYAVGYAVPFEQVMRADDNKGEAELTERSLYDKQKNVKVTDENLYAWAEIYVDGRGWTAADVSKLVSDDIISERAEEESNGDTAAEEQTEETTSASKAKMAKNYFADAAAKQADGVKSFAIKGKNTFLRFFLKPLLFLAVSVVIFAAVFKSLRYLLSDSSKKAAAIYTRLSRITGIDSGLRDICSLLADIGLDSKYTDCVCTVVGRAKYSDGKITADELKMLKKSYRAAVKKVIFYRIFKKR